MTKKKQVRVDSAKERLAIYNKMTDAEKLKSHNDTVGLTKGKKQRAKLEAKIAKTN